MDLDYDGGNWKQIKTLYERAAATDTGEGEEPVPRTLDDLLNVMSGYAGLSFAEDIRPLLGGTMYVGAAVDPAEPLSAETRDILEQVDLNRVRFTEDGRAIYKGHDGKPLRGITSAQVERALGKRGGAKRGRC